MSEWRLNNDVAKALKTLGWSPKSKEDKVHFLLSLENKQEVLENWEITKAVLINDIVSDNPKAIRMAIYTFIAIGKKDVIPDLINLLNKHGTEILAETYINCGNESLYNAAKTWASRNGYYLSEGNAASPVKWGEGWD